MGTSYQSIVTVHVHGETSREDVLAALEKELGAGHFLFRTEEGPGDLTVTAEVVADDASLAQRQAEHVVSEALGRVGLSADGRVTGTEIRSS